MTPTMYQCLGSLCFSVSLVSSGCGYFPTSFGTDLPLDAQAQFAETHIAAATIKKPDRLPETPLLDICDYIQVSSPYGYRKDPISGRCKFHAGIDLAIEDGQYVYAAANGFVKKIKRQRRGYGHYVVIQHNETYSTLYAHLGEIYVKEGDYLKKGKDFALTGLSGNIRGAHLHFELRKNGKPIDPEVFFYRQPDENHQRWHCKVTRKKKPKVLSKQSTPSNKGKVTEEEPSSGFRIKLNLP